MIGARYFASTSREIRTHSGSCSRCGKLGPILRPIDFCCSTVTRSLAMTWCRPRDRWEAGRTAFRSPWQNGVAERWVGSCRRDLLDHVIVLNERHLKRLMRDYIGYYHEDRTHLGLAKDTPAGRLSALRPAMGSSVRSLPRLGGLHHRYVVAA